MRRYYEALHQLACLHSTLPGMLFACSTELRAVRNAKLTYAETPLLKDFAVASVYATLLRGVASASVPTLNAARYAVCLQHGIARCSKCQTDLRRNTFAQRFRCCLCVCDVTTRRCIS